MVVALAMAGLAAVGNAEPQQQPQAPASDADAGSSELGPLEAIQAQATQTGSLSAPKALSCDTSRNSISLSWQAVNGADDYQVLLSGVPWAITASTAHQLGGLPENTRFEIGVQAGDDDGWGTSATKVCTTRAGGGISGASGHDIPTPSGVPTCASSTPTSITISWNAVADTAVTGYKVTASVPVTPYSGTLAGTTTVSGRTSTSATVAGLKPFTSYIMGVRAVKGAREGVGTGRPCSTRAEVPTCDTAPGSVTATWAKNVSSTSFAVHQWSVELTNTGTSFSKSKVVSGTTTSATLTGVPGGDGYKVSLKWRSVRNGTLILASETGCPRVLPPLAPPPPPTGLTCGTTTTTTITLEWNQADGANKYEAGYSPSNAAWEETTSRSFQFTNLNPDTRYTLHVRAGNNEGWSSPASKACRTKPRPLPLPPTGLSCTATTTTITLSWTRSTDATEYYVARTASGIPWEDTTDTFYEFTALSPGTSYTLNVRASNQAGWSTSASKTCSTKALPLPPRPGGLSCAAATTSITATWTAVNPSYHVNNYQASNDGGANWHSTAGIVSHTFENLTPDTAYSISARAHNTAGWGPKTDKTCRTKLPLPPAPTGLSCAAATTTTIKVTWTAVADADDYRVSKNAGDEEPDWTELDDGTAASHTFTDLTPGTEYPIAVQAENSAGWGPTAEKDCETKLSPPTCGATTRTSVALEWTQVDGVFKWFVARATTGDAYTDGRGLDASVVTTTLTGLTPGSSYTFVFWWKPSEDAKWIKVLPSAVCATDSLSPPANVDCEASDKAIVLKWDAVLDASAYQVSMKNYPWFTPQSASSNKFDDLTADTGYSFRVRAGAAADGTTVWGPQTSKSCRTLATPLAAPTGAACATSLSGAKLTWNEVDGATKYQVSSDGGTSWQAANGLSSHTVTGLVPTAAHTVQVQAGNAAAWGGTASVTCPVVVLPAPVGLACSTTLSSITLSWKAIDGVEGYTAEIKSSSDSTAPVLQTKTTTTPSATFTRLVAGESYYVSARGNYTGLAATTAKVLCFANASPPVCSTVGRDFAVVSWQADDMVHRWRIGLVVGVNSFSRVVDLDSTVLSAKFGGLNSETNYTFQLWWRPSASSPWIQVNPSVTCTTTRPALAAPIGVVCTAATTSVHLRWNPVDDATRHRVSKDGGTTWAETTGTVLTLSGLTANTSYNSIQVQTGDADSWDGTATTSCRTLPATALAAPTRLRCAATADSITLRWNQVRGATRYRAGHGHTWTDASSTARRHKFDGLSAGTTYELRVQAGNAHGWESVAAAKSCTTASAPLSSPALRCTAATTTSVTWAWDPVPGATGYQYKLSDSSTWQTVPTAKLTGPTITVTETGITPGTRHHLRLRATRTGETSPRDDRYCHSAPTGGGPAKPGTPRLRCAAATTTSVTVEWSAVYSATSYRVAHESNNNVLRNHQGTDLSVTVTSLSPNKESTVQVQARNATGSKLGRITCRTLAGVLQNLTASCAADTKGPPTITISWSATPAADQYQVAVARKETPAGGELQTPVIARYQGKQTGITADGAYGTAYQVTARAHTEAGWSEWASPTASQCPAAT